MLQNSRVIAFTVFELLRENQLGGKSPPTQIRVKYNFNYARQKHVHCIRVHISKEVLYLRWNEHHLRAYFETLMALLQIKPFLLQTVFLCETDIVIKIC